MLAFGPRSLEISSGAEACGGLGSTVYELDLRFICGSWVEIEGEWRFGVLGWRWRWTGQLYLKLRYCEDQVKFLESRWVTSRDLTFSVSGDSKWCVGANVLRERCVRAKSDNSLTLTNISTGHCWDSYEASLKLVVCILRVFTAHRWLLSRFDELWIQMALAF